VIVTVTSCSPRSIWTAVSASAAFAIGKGDEYTGEDCSSSESTLPIEVPRSFAYEVAFDFALATAAARASSVAVAGLSVVGITPPS
jgi:hypothetical protein